MGKRKTTKQFIVDAYEIHGNKYDYSKVEYVDCATKVCIICPEHGEFWQVANDHIRGNGCPKCALKSRANKNRKTGDKFIEEAVGIHGNKYDYSKVIYKDASTNVTIICPIHGEFEMRPHNHIGTHRQGCPLCGDMRKGDYQRGDTEKFIEDARKVHGDKYDYSKVEYYNNRQKVCIICPEHGEFWQKPLDHIHAHGCPECGKTLDISEKLVLKELQNVFDDVVYQYRPEWLGNITSRQSLDFYLPKYNIGVEYQGRQHFAPIRKFGGEEGYAKIVERDIRKFNKCKDNGVKVFYVSFEKTLPKEYHDKIYVTTEELITAIKECIEKDCDLIP